MSEENQKQKSVWKVTRWSVHDYAQFEGLVEQIRKLLDGLERITKVLGILERQHERLLEGVNSVSDAQPSGCLLNSEISIVLQYLSSAPLL